MRKISKDDDMKTLTVFYSPSPVKIHKVKEKKSFFFSFPDLKRCGKVCGVSEG